MAELFYKVLDYLQNFVSRYSYFITWDSYKTLFSKYFSVGGFIVGLIFVLFIWFAGTDEDHRMAGFFRVLSLIAVINSCVVLSNYLNGVFDQGISYSYEGMMINAPDNIISGFILTLVIFSCYRGFGGRAFLFGIAVNVALPMLNFSYFANINEVIPVIQMGFRLILVGFLCVIISHRKHFFTSWIWYFGMHLLIRAAVFMSPLILSLFDSSETLGYAYTFDGVMGFLSGFIVDFVIFAVVLVFAIVFDKGIINNKAVNRAV